MAGPRRVAGRHGFLACLVAGLLASSPVGSQVPPAAGEAQPRTWLPLEKDGVHDPRSPAARMLQQPKDALSVLPGDSAGNLVRWVDALRSGAINPRASLFAETRVRIHERDVLLNRNGGMPPVCFPHGVHTQWLDCNNCHEHLFKSQEGANPISMLQILQGEQCGLCHGAVSFPLTECNRCHNTPRPSGKPLPPRGADLRCDDVKAGKW